MQQTIRNWCRYRDRETDTKIIGGKNKTFFFRISTHAYKLYDTNRYNASPGGELLQTDIYYAKSKRREKNANHKICTQCHYYVYLFANKIDDETSRPNSTERRWMPYVYSMINWLTGWLTVRSDQMAMCEWDKAVWGNKLNNKYTVELRTNTFEVQRKTDSNGFSTFNYPL